jgi:hypothetical protein
MLAEGIVDPEFYVGAFGDRRLMRTGAALFSRIVQHQCVCLRRLGGDRAGEVRFGRWLRHPQVSRQEIMRESSQKTAQLSAGLHVLAIQDSSELNYQRHAGRIAGLGKVGNGKDVGLFIHPVLTLEAHSHACLGLAHQHTWVRTKTASAHYPRLPIEEKESYRWLQAAQASKQVLAQAAMITFIADREADLYEEWDRIPDHRSHLLIRVCRDRTLVKAPSLYVWLAQQPVRACYALPVAAQPAKADYGHTGTRQGKRSAHQARLELRYGAVEIVRPRKCTDKTARPSRKLWAIEVRERADSVVGDEAPIHWRLLTTHGIESVAEALQAVDWYCARWQIEQLFRTLKQQGLDIESSQVEDADSLMKLANLAAQAAVRTLQLTLARDGNTDRAATDVFDEQDLPVLEQLQSHLEGRTIKQQNPHAKGSLAWAAWSIARLGGWNGYASEAKPGPITMLHGQQRFAAMAQGWKLAKMCA